MLSIAMNYPRPFDAQEFRSRDQSRNHPQTGGEITSSRADLAFVRCL